MTIFSSDRVWPAALTEAEAETLAAKRIEEMIQRWRQGERPLAEEFLSRPPELWEHAAAAAELIYEEFCLRQEYGTETPVEEILLRFPQWRPQLEVLFDLQHLLGPRRPGPQFPEAGEILDDFLLLAELGSGANGRVFLASQLSLGDRPVVLKLTARDDLTARQANEHVSLARLQHTHIVPLYSVQDYPARGLRGLCMPYFGGATLAHLLEAMRWQPPARRTAQSLLEALRSEPDAPARERQHPLPRWRVGLKSPMLSGASYVQAICWIGACLADALQYAHERGLLHLDIKPSNVLLAADGQPMLLDFHLAREPIALDGTEPSWLGGTAGYMSPEQQAALLAIEQRRNVALPVDGRSDIYSLGVVLYEALGGTLPAASGKARPLHLCNSQVSLGLADLVSKCLASNPDDRYPDMAALATDLRRHLAHLPLLGVRNRSLVERWQKWQRRRPHAVALLAMILAVLTAAGAAAFGMAMHFRQQIQEARTALEEGRIETRKEEWEEAITQLWHGLSLARGIPFQVDLVHELEQQLNRAKQGSKDAERTTAVRKLHELTNRIRVLSGADQFPPGELRGLEASCRAFWENRGLISERLSPDGGARLDPSVRDDLLDLAIFWADLQVRLAAPNAEEAARRKAKEILAEARTLFAPVTLASAPAEGRALSDQASITPWEHYAQGRYFLSSGDLQRAAEELDQAVHLQPQGLWPNFYQGLCAYRRGRYAEAVAAYSVCIGAAPEPAVCFYNRALAFNALGRTDQALHDYDQALRLDPTLAAAALNRGMLHYHEKRYGSAMRDLQRASDLGADPAVVSLNLALANLARGERAAALDNLRQTLRYNPHQEDARKLYENLLAR